MSQLPIKTRATYSWGGNKKTKELGFMEGDVIEILKVVNDGVYFGESQRTKLKGFFPAKYVDCDLISEEPSYPSLPSTPISMDSKNTSTNSLFTLKKVDKSTSTLNTDDIASYERGLIPPSPPKHMDSKSSKKFTSSYVQQLLDSSTYSTDTGTSSTFGHSDFSATSAGSYMRHKEDYDFKLQSMMNSQNASSSTRKALNDIIDKNEKKKQPKFFRDLMGYKEDTEPSFDDRIYLNSIAKMNEISLDESGFENRVLQDDSNENLKRAKTLSGSERAQRSKRVLEEQPDIVLKPQECISNVNYEERDITNRKCSYNIDAINFDNIDMITSRMQHGPYETPQQFTMNTILKTFDNELDISRSIYTYLTHNFKLIKRRDEKLSTKRMFESDRIHEIMQTNVCTPHQLVWIYYLMAETAGLEVEIILGYLKHPFAMNETVMNSKKRLIINHSWISIKIDGEYRFIDIILGNPTNELSITYPDIWDTTTNWKFYYLARPFHLVHTHNPRHIDQQHIVPPVDVIAQLSLPPLYASAINAGISWRRFNAGIFELKDYELYDFEIEIPEDYLVYGKFKPYDNAFECVDSFVQIYYKNDVRIAHFQGIMSQGCPSGFVYVVGKNEFAKKWDLLLSIPCFHKGKWKAMDWVRKVPGLNGVDIYLKEPKIKELKMGEHNFDIRVYATSEWVKEVMDFFEGSVKLGLFPPNKQIIELDITHHHHFNDTVNLNKKGPWRLGVLDVKLMRWKVIAEWSVI